MPDQRDVQQLIQSLTPSAVNNGNPNTVYNQPQPQGGYIPPTFDPGTNTWRINPAPAPSAINWQQMSASQPQTWGWQQPVVPTPPSVTPPVTTPTTPVPTTPVIPGVTPPEGGNSQGSNSGYFNPSDNGGRPGGNVAEDGCVVVDTYLLDFDRADDVQVGDEMFVIDPVSYRKSVGRVQYSETKLMPCVRITTESGITLDCSTTAPIADEKGEQVLAPNLLHKLIPVCDRGAFYLDRVESIEDLGEREVRHITVEDNFFLAGKEKGRYIFHHNMKMSPGSYIPYGSGGMDFMFAQDSGGRGAESMGNHSMFGSGGAQAGRGNYTPTGQGLIDAFGEASAPAVTDNSGYMTSPWAGTGTSPVANWNTSWMQPSAAGANIPTMPPVQAEVEGEGFFGGLWDKIKGGLLTVADAIIPGNLYHSDTGEVAPWQAWVTSAADGALGLGGVGQQAWDSYGKNNLKDGYDATSSAERTAIGNLQYQYQQASPQKQAQMLQSMTKPGSGYPQSVIDAITGTESYWQGTR